MSHLLDKSEQNKTIAHYLHTSSVSCYPASVHCCYYSCLQKIIYLFNEKGETQNIVATKVKGGKGGTHDYYIKEIGGLILKYNKADAFVIRTHLTNLRALRIEADYVDVEITEDNAEKAYMLTEEVHKLLKKHFKL